MALVAVLVTVNSVNSLTIWVETVGSDGATLISLTMTVNWLVLVRRGLTRSKGLLLVTIVVMVLVVFFCASEGVHVMMPPALMLAPVGGLTSA